MRQSWLNRRREQFIADRLETYRLSPGASVLEIGSGTGLLLRGLSRRFPHLRFIGLEPIPAYVDFARRQEPSFDIEYLQGAAEDLERLWSRPVNAILSNDVLHHVRSLDAVTANMRKIAAPGCRWLSIEPNWKNPYTLIKQSLMTDERNFWPGEFRKKAIAAGWQCEDCKYLFLVPPFIATPPPALITAEQWLEGIPFLAGGVSIELF